MRRSHRRLFARRAADLHDDHAVDRRRRHDGAPEDDQRAGDDLEPHADAQRHPRRDRGAAAGGRAGGAHRAAVPRQRQRLPPASRPARSPATVGVTVHDDGSECSSASADASTPGARQLVDPDAPAAGNGQSLRPSTRPRTDHGDVRECTRERALRSAGSGACSARVVPSGRRHPPSFTNGSTGTVLKLFGDINADGSMVYIEYTCDIPAPVSGVQSPGNLYRNSMAWNAAAQSPAPPRRRFCSATSCRTRTGAPCFTYQTRQRLGTACTYRARTSPSRSTVQTQQIDPVTKQYQTETKALLNVSPRNVFNAWTLASLGVTDASSRCRRPSRRCCHEDMTDDWQDRDRLKRASPSSSRCS